LKRESEARRLGQNVPILQPNVPPAGSNNTSEQTSGPVHLGEEVPGPRELPPFTPVRHGSGQHSQFSNGYSLSNGSHNAHSNISTVPSRPQEDAEMTDSQDVPGLVNTQDQVGFPTAPRTGQNTQSQLEQKTSVMRMAPGSQPHDYINSASTTTSGNKTSDRDRSSGHSGNTQQSNGIVYGNGPDFGALGPAGGSQFPDTQEPEHPQASPGSQPASQASQAMGPPPANRTSSINALLNNTTSGPESRPIPTPILIPTDPVMLRGFWNALVQKSSGLGVEQLEQVMSSLMRAVWNTRGEWNRNHAIKAVSDAFNETIKDIEECQAILAPSQPSQRGG